MVTSRAYLETLWSYSVYTELMAIDGTDQDKLEVSMIDSKQYDEIAQEELANLFALLRDSSLNVQVCGELERIANLEPDDFTTGTFQCYFISLPEIRIL